MSLMLAVLIAAAVLANSAAGEAKARYTRLVAEARVAEAERAAEHRKVENLRQAMAPVREFTAAWRASAKLAEKEAAERVRSDMEAIAQRQLGLVTDNAITPQPTRYALQGQQLRVQQVTLRASGKDLAALLTWLGKVEEKYPAALIEHCEFSSNVGGNTGLTIRLVQPLDEPGPPQIIAPAILDAEAIAAIGWRQYLPARVKAAVGVGVQRNPLQPAISGESRSVPMLRDETDELTPRLELALDGRIRSVIRGSAAIVVVDGRVFRVGDELVLGASRTRPVPDAKTKLKEIADDRLVFHVAGGTNERPLQCDVAYVLPAFLKAR